MGIDRRCAGRHVLTAAAMCIATVLVLAEQGRCEIQPVTYVAETKARNAIDFVKDPERRLPTSAMEREEYLEFFSNACAVSTPLKIRDVSDQEKVQQDLTEFRKAIAECVSDAASDYDTHVDSHDRPPTVLLANALAGSVADPKPSSPGLPKFLDRVLVRRSHEQAAIRKATAFDKAEGALVSFTRDFDGVADIWEIHGSVMYPFLLYPADGPDHSWNPGISSIYLMPSVSFDRLSNNTDETKEVDSLVPRLGFEVALKTRLPFAGNEDLLFHYVRGNLTYATDFDLESSVFAGEFQWEPVFPWSEASRPLILLEDVVEWRLRGYLHAEIGRTNATGNKSTLVKDQDFLRIGPKLQLELFPRNIPRLSFALKYEYLEGSTGEPGHSDLFEANMSWELDAKGHVALTLAYRNGDIPLTKEPVDSFNIGVSLKF